MPTRPEPSLPDAPVSPFRPRRPARQGRAFPPHIVTAVRTLIERDGLSRREAAEGSGVPLRTVHRLARQYGWQGAKDRPARPYRYPPEMREAARLRVEGTRDPMMRIARELGITKPTLVTWQRRFGWTRPDPPAPRGPAPYRSRRFGRGYGGDARATARDLVTGTAVPMTRIAVRVGISLATLYAWRKAGNWERPGAGAGPNRRHPPYPASVVEQAGELFRTTTLSASLIAERVGATRERVWAWGRANGWTRPLARTPPRRRDAGQAASRKRR